MDDRLWSASQTLAASLGALPGSAYLVLAALCLALGSFAVLGRAARLRQLREEAAFQRAERERRRQSAEAACQAAAAAIGRAQSWLAAVQPENASTQQAVADDLAAALGALHASAAESTLRATSALATAYASGRLQLRARARPVADLRLQIERMDAKISHLNFERDQLMAGLTRLAGEGMDDQGGLWSDMNLRFDRLEREIASTMELRNEKLGELLRLERQLEAEAARASLKLAKLAVPAWLALRREAGVAVDEEEYRAIAEVGILELERAVAGIAEPEAPAPRMRRDPAPAPESARAPEVRLRNALRRDAS